VKRRFNVTGSCDPQRHYMVRLDDRLKKIKEDYVDYGSYFVINRGRQYGKTTTLKALAKYLSEEYIVFSLDFQQMSTSTFADDTTFIKGFVNRLLIALKRMFFEDKEKIVETISDVGGSTTSALVGAGIGAAIAGPVGIAGGAIAGTAIEKVFQRIGEEIKNRVL